MTYREVVDLLNELNDENKNLKLINKRQNDALQRQKDRITEIKQDEHQLSLSFLEYERKVQETLQKHYDKRIGNDILIEELANDLGVELE